jgi:hypothetical protein
LEQIKKNYGSIEIYLRDVLKADPDDMKKLYRNERNTVSRVCADFSFEPKYFLSSEIVVVLL